MLAIDSDPQSLDPRFGTDANTSRLTDLLHAGLTRGDDSARRVPDVASSWEWVDPQTIVFHLRHNFRFSDGTPLTADDVVATYRAVMDPSVASPKRTALAMLRDVDARDASTVVMRLRVPFPPFLDATGLGILPRAHAADRGEVSIGAGPFRVVGSDRGDRTTLAPNEGFPSGPPRLSPLVFRVVPDAVTRVLELSRGGVQLLEETPEPEVLEWLRARPDLVVRQRAGSSFDYLAMNLRVARLADRRVREAIALAVDSDSLVRFVLGGAARPATGLLSPEHWAFAPQRPVRHDPRRARRLLDRAGYRDPDGPGPLPRFRLVYKTSTQPGRRRLAEAIQAQLADVGIALDVRTLEWGTLYADVRTGNFELCALAWVGIGDPDFFYLAFHSTMTPPDGYNRGAYRSRVMDQLTRAGRNSTEAAVRQRVYARVQRRLGHDLPVVPLWWEDRIVIHSRRLTGFEPTASGDLRGLAQARMN